MVYVIEITNRLNSSVYMGNQFYLMNTIWGFEMTKRNIVTLGVIALLLLNIAVTVATITGTDLSASVEQGLYAMID